MSFSTVDFSHKVMTTDSLSEIFSSIVAKPMEVKTNVFFPAGTWILNSPAVLVLVLFEPPFTVTVTPGTGCLFESKTLPDIVFCACALRAAHNTHKSEKRHATHFDFHFI